MVNMVVWGGMMSLIRLTDIIWSMIIVNAIGGVRVWSLGRDRPRSLSCGRQKKRNTSRARNQLRSWTASRHDVVVVL